MQGHQNTKQYNNQKKVKGIPKTKQEYIAFEEQEFHKTKQVLLFNKVKGYQKTKPF